MNVAEALDLSFRLREQLINDPHRPRYHFLPADGFWNDVNGTLFWKGRYHLFFLARRKNENLSAIAKEKWPSLWEWQPVWSHISSRDLVHWRYHPSFLPSGSPDMPQGLFSGDAVEGADRPTLIYHVPMQGTCIAVSNDDDLDEWSPLPENPVVHWKMGNKKNTAEFDGLSQAEIQEHEAIGDLSECAIFDPCGWKEDETYYALIGNKNYRAGFEGDSTSLFRSNNLTDWEYVGPFYKSERRWTEEIEDCSCPDFFPFGSKHMLLMHTHQPYTKSQYYLGTYRNHRFYPEIHGQLSYRGSMHMAPETLIDGDGRRIYWGWIADAREREEFSTFPERGWSSIMTLPWHLYPSEDNRLRIKPVDELKILRHDPVHVSATSVAPAEESTIESISSNCMEIKTKVNFEDGAIFGFKLLCSPDGREETVITYDGPNERFVVDYERASLSRGLRYPGDELSQIVPYKSKANSMSLDIFVDRSVIEIFVDSEICIVQRVYPTLKESTQVRLFSRESTVLFENITKWEMDAANPW